MDLYRNLDHHFAPCRMCAECCTTPGFFLPEQIPAVAHHLGLTGRELFDRYLLAELCAPTRFSVPVLLLQPVKAQANGRRFPQRLYDDSYRQVEHHACIFLDGTSRRCAINEVKPFECAMMICRYMTGEGRGLHLGRDYFYDRWKGSQDTVYALFPELRVLSGKLRRSVEESGRLKEQRDRVLRDEVGRAICGRPVEEILIF